jgi:putative ABC transport system permease protein
MRGLLQSLRHTLRLLIKTPGFTVTAVLILGIGIGANTVIFSLINGALLKPLPYPDSERLVQLFQPGRNFDRVPFDFPDYLDFSANQHCFDGLSAYLHADLALSGRGAAERVSGLYVTGNFFRVLSRPFLVGRPFGEGEDKPDVAGAVVISEHLWRSRFNSDPSLIETNLTLNGKRFQVIGVTPAQANESAKVDLYVPLSQSPDFGTWVTTQRGSHNFACIGRLKPGSTVGQAQTDLEVIRQNLADRYPDTDKAFGISVVPYLNSVMNDYATTLWILETAVVCLLLITCANVANLLLARAQERRRELNIRSALGASRLRLIAQVLIETSLLAATGGIVGLLLSAWGLDAVRALAPEDVSRFQEIKLDGGSLAFVVIITALTALGSGLFPALVNSRTNIASALKQEGNRGGTPGRQRYRGQAFLVTGQVALTSVLLIGAGLLARSFQALQNAPLGFNPSHVLTADINLSHAKYSTQAACQAVFDRLLTKVRQLPGVIAAGLNSDPPFLSNNAVGFGIAGQPDPNTSEVPGLDWQWITPDYFRAAEMPLLQGRSITDQDGPDKEKVVIISQSIAQRFFPGENPVGKQLHDRADVDVGAPERHLFTIVGVVGNVQHNNPESQQSPFQAYYPYAQNVWPNPISWGTLVIRTESDPRLLIAPLEKVVASIDPNLPLSNVDPFNDFIGKSFATKRLAATVVSLFSGAALLLAAVGLYGVLSYSVAQRKREIGVRIALGAESKNILQLVVKQGFTVVGVGLIIGLVAALALSHLIAGILYGVSVADPISVGLSVLVLSFTTLIACLLPAFRAIRINPITALRE